MAFQFLGRKPNGQPYASKFVVFDRFSPLFWMLRFSSLLPSTSYETNSFVNLIPRENWNKFITCPTGGAVWSWIFVIFQPKIWAGTIEPQKSLLKHKVFLKLSLTVRNSKIGTFFSFFASFTPFRHFQSCEAVRFGPPNREKDSRKLTWARAVELGMGHVSWHGAFQSLW